MNQEGGALFEIHAPRSHQLTPSVPCERVEILNPLPEIMTREANTVFASYLESLSHLLNMPVVQLLCGGWRPGRASTPLCVTWGIGPRKTAHTHQRCRTVDRHEQLHLKYRLILPPEQLTWAINSKRMFYSVRE